MYHWKFRTLIGLVCLVSTVFYGIITHSQPPSASVRLTLNPAIEHIFPFEAEAETYQPLAELKLQAIDATGQPIPNAKFHIQLQAPPKTPWFTTDFPVVEGTTLLDLDAIAPDGTVQLQQTFPIRGTYQLKVEVSPQTANAFPAFQQTLPLTLNENSIKYRNLAVLVAILLMAGLSGGWLMGGQPIAQPGEIAPPRVRLLLSGVTLAAIAVLIFVNVSAEIVRSGMPMPMSHMTEPAPSSEHASKQQSQSLQVQLSGDASTTVGQLSQFKVTALDPKTQQPITDVLLNIKVIQLEENWVAFAHKGFLDSKGSLTWREEFFDGAPHKIVVDILPKPGSSRQFRSLQVARTVAVEGVAPPLHVRLISLVYFTLTIALGLLIGFMLRRKRFQRVRPISM